MGPASGERDTRFVVVLGTDVSLNHLYLVLETGSGNGVLENCILRVGGVKP